ncbi:tetratricopeptide repeat protein [candidate division WOR-3 bacterium]|nr:tetratricopeptide repeat protein [candidate division WOR-3 bacterium]
MAIINICRVLISIIIFANSETPYELFSIGCQLELDGKIEEAIEYYKQVKDLTPESSEIYISLANALYQIRKFDEGINIAKEGLLITDDKAQMYHTIAIGNIGKGDFEEAIEFQKKSVQIEPENIDIYNSLSILYEVVKDKNNARQVLVNMPDSLKTPDVFTRLGSLSGKLSDHETAIKYYHQAYTLDTTNIAALIGIGTGFDILNVKDSAIYYYEKSLREDTLVLTVGKRLVDLYSDTDKYGNLINMAQRILEFDYNDGHIRRSLGFGLYKTGMLREALNEFLIASRLDPKDTYSRFYTGRIYLEQGNYNAALKEIKQAIKINPDFVELWVYLGFVAIDIKDFETAEYAFTEAAYHGGDLIQIYYLFGVTAEMQQRYNEAYLYYHKSLKVDPQSLSTLEALASLCDRIEKKDEAFRTFQKIIELDTTNSTALNYVGYSYAEQNDSLEYALQLINKALLIEKDNGYYIDSRGWVFYQMGKYDEALEELKNASAIIEDAVILEHLGDVYLKLNDSEKAKEAYEKALEYDFENSVLKEKLQKLSE